MPGEEIEGCESSKISTHSELLFHAADFALTPFFLHKDKTSVTTQTAPISGEHQVTLLTECTAEGARSEALCIIFRKFLSLNLHVIYPHNNSKKEFTLS